MKPNAGPWFHEDGTPCPSYYAPEVISPTGQPWWCTEHQQRVTASIESADMASAQHITEVSATVDAALTRTDLEGMNEAERLALVVGAAYGKALSERDQARAELDVALTHLRAVVDEFPATSWAHSNIAVESAREFIQAIRPVVDSRETPDAQETP